MLVLKGLQKDVAVLLDGSLQFHKVKCGSAGWVKSMTKATLALWALKLYHMLINIILQLK